LFSFIHFVAHQAEALHNTLAAEHEQQQQQLLSIAIECD